MTSWVLLNSVEKTGISLFSSLYSFHSLALLCTGRRLQSGRSVFRYGWNQAAQFSGIVRHCRLCSLVTSLTKSEAANYDVGLFNFGDLEPVLEN